MSQNTSWFVAGFAVGAGIVSLTIYMVILFAGTPTM